jgi:hypothetical protein
MKRKQSRLPFLKYKCVACCDLTTDAYLTWVPNPCSPGDTIVKCPNCEEYNTMNRACSEPGCRDLASLDSDYCSDHGLLGT